MSGDVGAAVAAVAPVLASWGVRSRHGEWSDCEAQESAAREVLSALAPLIAEREKAAKAEALREAASEVGAALSNEIGSGHTSTYSVRGWLRDRAAALDPKEAS